MRYIHKGKEPAYMTEWKELRKGCGQKLTYNEFDQKARLNKDLRKEQHNICCYCQRVVDHYQTELELGKPETAAHNEHLYPENVKDDPMSVQLQMDYSNIYACCVDSRGKRKHQKNLQHCGEAKANKIIPELIKHPDCADYFYYSISGKIEPKPSSKERENDAKKCIDVLNLNCHTLKDDRKVCIDSLLEMYKSKSVEDLEIIRESLIASESYPAYVELRLQFIDHLIKRKKQNTD